MTGLALVYPKLGAVLDIDTGEAVNPDTAPTDQLARMRAAYTSLRHQLDEATSRIDAELVGRVDQAVRSGQLRGYTARVDGWEIRVPSPTAGGRVAVSALRRAMLERADELELADEAIEQAFTASTIYKLNRQVFNAIAKQAPELQRLLEQHTSPPASRRATVTVLDPRPTAIEATAEEDQ
jgi:hypothetical protein